MKKMTVALAAAVFSLVGFADGGTWFTAGFGEGVASSGGVWSETVEGQSSAPVWDGEALALEDVVDPVVFKATNGKTPGNATIVFRSEVSFQGFEELPALDESAKAGVCALTGDNYYVVGYDAESGKKEWVNTEIPADFSNPVSVTVSVVDGKAVYAFGASTKEVAVNADSFQEVCYSGNGSVSKLEGDYSVKLTLPEVDGLTAACDDEYAPVGAEVAVEFAADTKIPSKGSAVYIVGEDGTLTLKPGETPVEALDPGAKIGSVLYLTFADAYTAAEEEDVIVLCGNQNLAVDIEKNVTIDLVGKVMTVAAPVAINKAKLTFEDSAEVDKGKLVIAEELSIADSRAKLDISKIVFVVDGEGYLSGIGGLFVAESPNKLFGDGSFGEEIPELLVAVDEDSYEGNPEAKRFVIEGEVAYATVGEEDAQYIESFASVQAAIDAADEVYLCFDYGEAPDGEEIAFKESTVVYAYTGEEDLVNCTLLPADQVVFDEDLGENGGWKIAGEPPVTYTVTYVDAVVTNGVTEYTVETDTFALPTAADVEERSGGQFKGWTNEVGTAVTEVVKGTTGDLTFYAVWESAGVFYPTYIDQSDDELKAKFNKWASEVAGDRDGGSANLDAFLLNCAPANVEIEKGKFVISSITKNADGDWEVKVGEKGQDDEYGNGYINIISVKTDKFPTAGADSDFFQATLTIQPTVVK